MLLCVRRWSCFHKCGCRRRPPPFRFVSQVLRHTQPALFDEIELATVASARKLSGAAVEASSWEAALLDEDALFAEMEEMGI